MIKSLKSWLSKPYYADPSLKYRLYTCLIISFFVFIFLYVFKPFQINIIENNNFTYTLGYGVLTFGILFLNLVIFPLTITNSLFNEEKRTILREIVIILICILTIGIGCWFYFVSITKGDEIRQIGFAEMILNAFYVGFIPVIMFLFFDEKWSREKRIKISKEIMDSKRESHQAMLEKKIQIFGENNKENIKFNNIDLIYISSQANYASFFINTENGVEEVILRITLSKIMLEFKEFSNLVRCHKSYIVNSLHIDSISGNARGYFLTSNKVTNQIPVSRSFNKTALEKLIR